MISPNESAVAAPQRFPSINKPSGAPDPYVLIGRMLIASRAREVKRIDSAIRKMICRLPVSEEEVRLQLEAALVRLNADSELLCRDLDSALASHGAVMSGNWVFRHHIVRALLGPCSELSMVLGAVQGKFGAPARGRGHNERDTQAMTAEHLQICNEFESVFDVLCAATAATK